MFAWGESAEGRTPTETRSVGMDRCHVPPRCGGWLCNLGANDTMSAQRTEIPKRISVARFNLISVPPAASP